MASLGDIPRYVAVAAFEPVDKPAWDNLYQVLTTGLRQNPAAQDPDLYNNGFMRLDKVMTLVEELAKGHQDRDISAIIKAAQAIDDELIRYFQYPWIYKRAAKVAGGRSTPPGVLATVPHPLHADSSPLDLVRVVAALCWEVEHQRPHDGSKFVREIKCIKIVCMLQHLLQGLYLENHPQHTKYVVPSSLSYKKMAVGNTPNDCPMSLSREAIRLLKHQAQRNRRNDRLARQGAPKDLNQIPSPPPGGMTVQTGAQISAFPTAHRDIFTLQSNQHASSSKIAARGSRQAETSELGGVDPSGSAEERDSQDNEAVPRLRERPTATAITPTTAASQGYTRPFTARTMAQQAKGKRINEQGVEADTACARCQVNNFVCRVPVDPRRLTPGSPDGLNTFKCGNCLHDKQGCSFNADSPGRRYPQDMLSRYSSAERPRGAGGAKVNRGGSAKHAKGRG